MPAPMFSVVIPTHNRSQRVSGAAASVLRQLGSELELVIVDDGSHDATPEVLQTLQSPRCRTIRHEVALGVSAARNRGAVESRGDFIVFLDDDDSLRPGALELLRCQLDTAPYADFAWGGRSVTQRDRAGRVTSIQEDVWHQAAGGVSGSDVLPYVLDIAASCTFTVRRELFLDMAGFDETLRVSEDRDLLLRLAEAGHLGRAVPSVLVDIDQHLHSLSRGATSSVGPQTDLRVIEKHCKYLTRAEHAAFLNEYLRRIFAGFLEAGDRQGARRIVAELRKRGAADRRLARLYLRHSPASRWVKARLHYDSLRRAMNLSRGTSLPAVGRL